MYQALPDLDLTEIDTSVDFLSKRLRAPILINAMTGGHPDVKEINRSLARAAARAGIAMAVGSQRAGLEDPSVAGSYQVVREENPDGLILANLGANASSQAVTQALQMIDADALQLHLNVAHELAMPEGDRDFRGVLTNIEAIVRTSPVPVIIKEVGGGLSREVAQLLYHAGVSYLDVGGSGGTNFVHIEHNRTDPVRNPAWDFRGISTAVSLLETLSLSLPMGVIASGGIGDSRQIALALALGAQLVGMAGAFLHVLYQQSEEALHLYIEELIDDLRKTMLTVGARSLADLPHKPVVITGNTAAWLERRGIDINKYARR